MKPIQDKRRAKLNIKGPPEVVNKAATLRETISEALALNVPEM